MNTERPPLLSLVLGYGPALLQLLIGVGIWLLPLPSGLLLIAVGQIWAASILLFLAGVRRGLSFFTEGGPRPAQIATMMWLFLAGLAGLLLPPALALLAAAIGYLSIAILDPLAAKRGEVPAHFATLRPPQMAIFVIGIASLFAWLHVNLG